MGVSQEPFDPRLIRKIEALRAAPAISSESAERCRTAFIRQVTEMADTEFSSKTVSNEASWRQIGWKSIFTNLFDWKERSPMFTTLALIVVTFSLLFGGAGATVFAAQDSLPGEILYPLKSLSEQARLEFAPEAADRFTLHMQYIERRVDEISRLAVAGVEPPVSLQNHLALQLDQSLQLAAGMEDPQAVKALSRLREMLTNQERILAAVNGTGGASVQAALLQVRQQIQERLRLVENGLQDPNMLRERLRTRRFAPGQGTGTPAANPSRTPSPLATQAQGAGNSYGPGPSASGTPVGSGGYGYGDCDGGTCTPHEYDYEYNEPGPHGKSTQEPGGNSYGPGPAPTQAPGGCSNCGQDNPSAPTSSPGSHDHPRNEGGNQNSGGNPGGGGNNPPDPGHGGGVKP
jgi:hypothetical protein